MLPSVGNHRSPPGPAVHGACEVEGGLKAEDRAVVEQGFVEELRAGGVSRVLVQCKVFAICRGSMITGSTPRNSEPVRKSSRWKTFQVLVLVPVLVLAVCIGKPAT
jgi:hypothetical protein